MIQVGQFRGPPHLFLTGTRAAIGQVLVQRVIEQHRVLGHHTDGGAKAVLGDGADILAVDGDTPAIHIENRNSSRARVDLPAPLAPTTATL